MLKRIRDLLGGRGRKKKVAEPAAKPAPPVHRGPKVVHRPIAKTDLDPDAVKIVNRLNRFDQSAYFVGGCVRDLLLERKPKDYDIGTSATPRQIKAWVTRKVPSTMPANPSQATAWRKVISI